jgi:hypothetical protein
MNEQDKIKNIKRYTTVVYILLCFIFASCIDYNYGDEWLVLASWTTATIWWALIIHKLRHWNEGGKGYVNRK